MKGSQLHFSSLSSALSNQDIIDVIGVSISNTIPKSLVIQIVKIRNGRISSRLGYTQSFPQEEQSGFRDDKDEVSENEGIGDILQLVLEAYYSNPSSEVPSTLVLPVSIPDTEVLKCLLTEKSGIRGVKNMKRKSSGDNNGSNEENIEKAMESGDVRIGLARDAGENHLIVYANHLAQKEAMLVNSDTEKIRSGLEGLAEMLELSVVPSVIEGYDISHSQGTNTVASKVVFIDGVPVKSLYRRYKLKTHAIAHGKIDDYLSMKEVLSRRFGKYLEVSNKSTKGEQRKKADDKDRIPDIILIDGGKGQLGAADEVLNSLKLSGGNNTILLSLAKQNEEVFVVGKTNPVNADYDESSAPMRILRQVRDEAHRYALSYHRALRSKDLLTNADDSKGDDQNDYNSVVIDGTLLKNSTEKDIGIGKKKKATTTRISTSKKSKDSEVDADIVASVSDIKVGLNA
jgi:excinuclease ABC subunit C